MKRRIHNHLFWILILGTILFGVVCWKDRRYHIVSMLIAFFACVPFYYAYEKREGSIRRMVILAVFTALAVIGRVIVVIPGFKPVTAVVIFVGIYMGSEAGFLCGSLSALLSNIFFGQGPWTPFQMVAWGVSGFVAGLPWVRMRLKKPIWLSIYGIISGITYSMIMDVWTVLSFDGQFHILRYLLALTTAIPVTIEYAVSNVVFLLLLRRSIGSRLERIKVKHGIF